MLDLYERAVAAMQSPDLNYPPQPTSWTFQSYIHGVPENPFDPASSGGLMTGSAELKARVEQIYGKPGPGTKQAAWKEAALACWGTCTHESPFFTTWHRWYLYYFERICRAACKDPAFALPYWNYASDEGASLQIPAKFTRPPSRLLFDDRGLGFDAPGSKGRQTRRMNDGGFLALSLVDYDAALGARVMFPSDSDAVTDPDAMGFTGRLEVNPHDSVHEGVGGWMGNVPSAAGDPLFYVHHCQIDRLCATWQAGGAASYNWGRTAEDPDEATWVGRNATFVDETGALKSVRLGGAVNPDALGYGYDRLAMPRPRLLAARAGAQAPQAVSHILVAAAAASDISVGSGGTSVPLTTTEAPTGGAPEGRASGEAGQQRLRAAAPAAIPDPARRFLVLKGLRLLRRPPAPLSVFINMPAATTPELGNPYYVGTLNLFNFDLGTGRRMSSMATSNPARGDVIQFDVTDVLARQLTSGAWDGKNVHVDVTTLGADSPGNLTYVTVSRIALEP